MNAPAFDATPWSELDASVADALSDRLEELTDEIAAGITIAVPEFAVEENPKLQRDVRDAVHVAVSRFIELVGTDEPALNSHVRDVFVGLGAAEAREDHGPDVLRAALRLSSRLMLREVVDVLAAHAPIATENVVGLAEAINVFIDEVSSASSDGFALQVRDLAGERDRARARLAELLVAGGASHNVISAAVTAIGWTTIEQFVPVILPLDQARDARFRFGSDGLILERVSDVVVLVRASARTDRTRLVEQLRGREAAIGQAVAWPELAEAVRLTELTSRLVPHHDEQLVFVADHLANLALRGEPAALAALTRTHLAPLADQPASQREALLVTMHSWLRHWGSRAAVAEDLYIHPQTVSYRIRKARELIGPALDDPNGRFELGLVLADLVGTRD